MLLRAARAVFQEDEEVADLVHSVLGALERLSELAHGEEPERALCAGMALAAVGHATSQATEAHFENCMATAEKVIKAAVKGPPGPPGIVPVGCSGMTDGGPKKNQPVDYGDIPPLSDEEIKKRQAAGRCGECGCEQPHHYGGCSRNRRK